MINTLNQALEGIYAQEEFNKEVTCSTCWNHPATQGALCADCFYSMKVETAERSTVGEYA